MTSGQIAPSRAKSNEIDRRQLMGSMRALALVPLTIPGWPGAEPASADAHLLALGVEFDRAEAVEAAAWARYDAHPGDDDDALNKAASALNEVTGKIVDRIEACKATTVAGVMVKVRALRWCVMDQEIDYGTFGYGWPYPLRGTPSADVRFLTAIANELMALSGAGRA